MALRNFATWWARLVKRTPDHQVQASGYTNEVFDSDIVHPFGIVTGIPAGTTVIALRMGVGRSNTVLLPIINEPASDMPSGETMLYATSQDGTQIVGQLRLTSDGKLAIHTQQEDLLAIQRDMLKLMQQLQTFGTPTTQKPSPDWLAKMKRLEERLNTMAIYQ